MSQLQARQAMQLFVDDLLTFTPSPIPTEDATTFYRMLARRQNLAVKPDSLLQERIQEKIEISIQKREPIILILATGGFKNVHAPNWPHIDWAEIFALRTILGIAAAIAASYPPGVIVEYSGDSEAIAYCNNIPFSAIAAYSHEFEAAIEIFQKVVPHNLQIRHRRLESFYDLPDLLQTMKKRADQLEHSPTHADLLTQFSEKAKHNFMTNGVVDFTAAPKEALDAAIKESVFLDRAWMGIDVAERQEYLEGGTHIPIMHTSSPSSIVLKSVKIRKVAFWLGCGIARLKENKVHADIIHATKLNSLGHVDSVRVDSPFAAIADLDTLIYTEEPW